MRNRLGTPAVLAIVLVLSAAAVLAGVIAGRGDRGPATQGTPTPIACTEEAKLCPDGSAVGRNGPECRFDPCPLEQGAGVVRGHVTIGPLQPVETPGGSPTVPPEAYASRWIVFTGSGGQYTKTAAIDADGNYAVWLWPGTYTVDINHGGIDFAKDLPKEIEVGQSAEVVLDIDIDTGIR